MVWGVGPVSCDLQVAGSIPVATRSRGPPYHRDFGERVVRFIRMVMNAIAVQEYGGYGRKLTKESTRSKNPNNYYQKGLGANPGWDPHAIVGWKSRKPRLI